MIFLSASNEFKITKNFIQSAICVIFHDIAKYFDCQQIFFHSSTQNQSMKVTEKGNF